MKKVQQGPWLCYCFQVTEAEIRRAIRLYGLKNLSQVQMKTRACTGCRTCRPDVEAILADEGCG